MTRIKQGVCLLAALLLALGLLAGCGKDEDESAASGSDGSDVSASDSASGDASTSGGDASNADGSAASGADGSGDLSGSDASGSGAPDVSAPPPAPAVSDGVFLCLNEERYEDDRAPTLTLDDGDFTFVVNTGDARMATLKGSYTLQGSALTLEVKRADEEDFLGEDLTVLDFTVVDEDNLRYTSGQLGLTNPGYLFTREGVKPPTEAQLAPDSAAGAPDVTAASGSGSGSAAADGSTARDSSDSDAAPASGGDASDSTAK